MSLLLINFYAKEISPADSLFAPNLEERYADDNHAAASNVEPAIIANSLATAATNMVNSAAPLDMTVLAAKLTVTLFNPWTKEFDRRCL